MTQIKEKTGIGKSVVIATVVAIRDVVKNGFHCTKRYKETIIRYLQGGENDMSNTIKDWAYRVLELDVYLPFHSPYPKQK